MQVARRSVSSLHLLRSAPHGRIRRQVLAYSTENKISAPNTKTTTTTKTSKAASTSTPKLKSNKSILPLHIVQSPLVKNSLPFLGNASYLALASGFLMTDMLVLRLALVGGYTGLVTFHILHTRPLRIPLRWSAVFVVVNAAAACFLIADRYGGTLSEEDEELYIEHFSMLSRGQFRQLLELGRTEIVADQAILTREGVPCERLYFLRKGNARLYLKNAFAAISDEGSFVNDVAFNQGKGTGAYGTVVTSGECTVLVWDKDTLRDHLRRKPDMDKNMKYCLSTHLVKALLQQREAAHMTIGQWSKERLRAPRLDA